ncbi:tyrosine-type recombinase/integrase [Alkalihalobacillus sp. BA299]|uniref:tyrosine-type recombinase/integrase n=1 Tax=Alkalihalobacillus sp. BA299 TaxID=2815938 RepID=UPI001ADC8132|nr:tyrosine-type recombinase/integrase [Alkalihalobacillus sp. BA299]
MFVKWALHFTLLLDKELETLGKIKYHASSRNSIAIHTLILRKPFKDFAEYDLEYAPKINSTEYSIFLLRRLRFHLGYSSVDPVKMKVKKKSTTKRVQKKMTWEDLYKHPVWGKTIKDYYDYMIIGDALPDYIKNMCLLFEQLLVFLEKQGLSDFSNFTYLDYMELTEHLSWGVNGNLLKLRTIVTYIARIKKLFVWGQGRPLFPNSLDFPEEEWSKMIKESHLEYRKSEGLSFTSNEIAEELVKTIFKYNPKNEIETLCRYFWMITASSTPRLSFVLNLEVGNCLKRMPNEPQSYGLYSPDEDKAGNKYGQFPVLDPMGTKAIAELEKRIQLCNFSPIYNEKVNRKYIHLFQLSNYPWRLTRDHVTSFLEKMKEEMSLREGGGSLVKASAHRFRTFLLTHIAMKSGDIEAVRIAAGHKDEKMTRMYLRSRASRNSLLNRVVQKFENNEITGRFYFRIISLLSAEQSPVDEMLRSLATDISLGRVSFQLRKTIGNGVLYESKWM